MAERLGAVAVEAHALNNTGAAQYTRRPPAGREQLERSLHLALKHDLREHVARAYVNLIAAEITHGHHALARQHLEAATAYLSARNLDAWSHYLAAWTCRLDLETGRWAEAAEGARQVLSRPQVAPVSRLPTLIVLARLRMRRGDPGAGELLQEATALARRTGEFQRLAPLAVAHAEAAWLGLPQADVPLANELLVAARARQAPAASEIAFWLGLAGAGQAGSEWTEPDRPFEQAVALFHAGGEAHMQAALGQLAALGCEATVARLHVRLREQGIRLPEPVIRGPRATTAAHPVGLTQREAQVLALIAQGLTNAEIAARLVRSAKTVDHHVSAILAKLNARSRAEASALAARLGLLDAGQSGEVPRQSG
jgi:DNA-binding CsgD family transcriptional regulator